ncbi:MULTISPECIES: phosphonate degradation HD-domain oxygenase [Silvimonas]|uniref:phosphonate degradation HD-domain oxygenase n=1 Tax=Silvimonas TaxID=300264 RepID=UPI0024B3B486|nr:MULTISPECIES: phosphonate degradation HD-domain oxygenase [Silvimonas]MDR3426351.1 HD domain-containing protein [Silvimonas sp.]
MQFTIDDLSWLYEQHGRAQYGGEAVSQLDHALQSAHFADQDGAPESLVIAALLHDFGHLVAEQKDDDLANGIDDRHEAVGVAALKPLFDETVLAPIALHVAAKRYLCATSPEYLYTLSQASRQSLLLQGGVMSDEEITRFEANPYLEAAIALRRYDDLAKVPDLVTQPLSHYLDRARLLVRARAAQETP